jgi:hypothetical protein
MMLKKFVDFLREREFLETHEEHPHKWYDSQWQLFHNRFGDDMELADKVIRRAGYRDRLEFIQDRNEQKYSKLKIPGQDNYVDNDMRQNSPNSTHPRGSDQGER